MLTRCGWIFPLDGESDMRVGRVHFQRPGNRHFVQTEAERFAGVNFRRRRLSREYEAKWDGERGSPWFFLKDRQVCSDSRRSHPLQSRRRDHQGDSEKDETKDW